MPNYGIIENDKITNVIVATDEENALSALGTVEIIETAGEPWINWVRIYGVWKNPEATSLTIEG